MAVKKLIEVALPLETINKEASREKSIRQGHPSTLHLWWARRPLAAARAVIWASIVNDPSSDLERFPTEESQNKERERLFNILEELVVWENSNNEELLQKARKEMVNSVNGQLPLLIDPFAGGGTIPLEGKRLGLTVKAQDLNPVAIMINKAMIEIPSMFSNCSPVNPSSNRLGRAFGFSGANGLAEDVKYYGNWIWKEAKKRIGHLYPDISVPKEYGGGKATPVAWIWTRTVKCPNPACACEMPLIKSFELSKKNGGCFVEPIIKDRRINYKVKTGKTKLKGTVNRKGAICLFCGGSVNLDYIRECGRKNQIGYQLLSIVVEGDRRKVYLPAEYDSSPAYIKRPEEYPDSEIAYYPGCTNCKIYGMDRFSDLMTNRQLTAMVTMSDLVIEVKDKIDADIKSQGIEEKSGYAEAVKLYLAFGVDRLASRMTKVCLWNTTAETIEQPFGRQAIPMVWTFPEANVFSNSTGGWNSSLEWIPKVLENLYTSGESATVVQADAMEFVNDTPVLVSTDPPYYSNVPYADLADFFYVWMRKMLKTDFPTIFGTISTPKANELVAEKYRCGGDDEAAKRFFEEGMRKTFRNIIKYTSEDYPLTVYYAFKEIENDEDDTMASSGWETMLSGLISAGFMITGTWPIRTERTSGLKNSLNALGTSIVLVCRKRPVGIGACTRRNYIIILKRELKTALRKLQSSNIAPVDLAQSAIGPGIEVFSRYEAVLEADGSPMSIRSALQIINQELDLYFNDQDEELDRESRFCIELYTQNEFNNIKFGEADLLARAKNTSVASLVSQGLISAQKGTVHLIDRSELSEKINDHENSIWKLCQQLTYRMEKEGIEGCAKVICSLYGSNAERAKDLAYRLYTIAERKKWAQEAYAYNALVVAWPEIQSRAAELKAIVPEQITLDNL